MTKPQLPPYTGPRAAGPPDGRCEACGRGPRRGGMLDHAVRVWWWRAGLWVGGCCRTGPLLRDLERRARKAAR
jgi:hypothetical protein